MSTEIVPTPIEHFLRFICAACRREMNLSIAENVEPGDAAEVTCACGHLYTASSSVVHSREDDLRNERGQENDPELVGAAAGDTQTEAHAAEGAAITRDPSE